MSANIALPDTAESLSGTRCLVTGGAGFIGSTLVDALLAQGAAVRVLDDFSSGFESNLEQSRRRPEFELLRGDAADAETVRSAVEDCDYIFHLAAMVSVPRSMREPTACHEQCASSTVHLLAAAEAAGVRRMVLSSTSAVYGNSPFVSKRETDPPAPMSPYAAAKLAAESYMQCYSRTSKIETVCLRYFNVFGPRQDPQSEYSAVIPRFVSLILAGKRPVIYGDGTQSRDFVFVRDVAKANLLAAAMPGVNGRVFNIARGQRTTLLELLTTLSELLQQPIDPIHDPPRPGDIKDSLADITHARDALGFEPDVDIHSGLRESIAYYRSLYQ
jgi:UDP-glucose 4-epimerase